MTQRILSEQRLKKKKLKKTQKQLNELREDFNKHQNEAKIFKKTCMK
jgi:hypothetical protein